MPLLSSKGLRRLLDDEPALTLRVLTDPLGPRKPDVATADRLQQALIEGIVP
jgi:hypothetical protein